MDGVRDSEDIVGSAIFDSLPTDDAERRVGDPHVTFFLGKRDAVDPVSGSLEAVDFFPSRGFYDVNEL